MALFKKNQLKNQMQPTEQQKFREKQQEQKLAQSKQRLLDGLPAFRLAYRELVLKYGIKLIPLLKFDQFQGIIPVMTEVECGEEVAEVKQAIQKSEANGVVKN